MKSLLGADCCSYYFVTKLSMGMEMHVCPLDLASQSGVAELMYRTHLRSFTGGNRTDIGGGGRVRLGDDCVRQEFLA